MKDEMKTAVHIKNMSKEFNNRIPVIVRKIKTKKHKALFEEYKSTISRFIKSKPESIVKDCGPNLYGHFMTLFNFTYSKQILSQKSIIDCLSWFSSTRIKS